MHGLATLKIPTHPPRYVWSGGVPAAGDAAAATVVVEATSPVQRRPDGWHATGSCVVRVIGVTGITGPSHHREDEGSAIKLAESLIRRMRDARGL